MFSDWTPIHQAGEDGEPIALGRRAGIVRRLQDGLLSSRATLIVRVHRPKVYADTSYVDDKLAAAIAGLRFSYGDPVEERDSNVPLGPELWSTTKLGHLDLEHWTTGEERLVDRTTADPSVGYEGDRATFYGIALRESLDTSGERAGFDDAVNWCVEWLAHRRSLGLPSGENVAWPEFHALPQHIGLDRDNVFRPAFRAAKSGKR